MLRMLLVRHGKTAANASLLLDSKPPGLPLTPDGVREADELAASLADGPVTGVCASLALRAQQTAEPVARLHGQPVKVLAGVHEAQFGDWEGRGDAETFDEFLRLYDRWLDGEIDLRIPGGESGREVLDRFLEDVQGIRESYPSGVVVVVSHGAAIRLAALHLATNVTRAIAGARFIPTTGHVVLEADPEVGWHCTEWLGERLR